MSPLASADDDGFAIAKTSDRTVAASQTGFFNVVFPNFRIVDFPTAPIGQGLAWVQNVQPIRIAGLPQNTIMIFPAMTEITRIDNGTGRGANNTSYIINNNFSKPYYPGNMIVVKNITNEKGQNQTVIDRAPRDYMTIIATPEQIATKRSWRECGGMSISTINLDIAYSGETCFPDHIFPVKNPYAVTFYIPLNRSNSDALILTQPGRHLKRVFWPVRSCACPRPRYSQSHGKTLVTISAMVSTVMAIVVPQASTLKTGR